MCRFRSLLALVAAQLICSGSGVSIHTPVGGPNDAISYKRLLVDSLIVSRFAVTTVTSVIRNNANESKGLDFQVQLPESAFVSKFTMTVNDKVFHGISKEKEVAAREFNRSQEAGQNVGLVESRGTEVFSVRTNTAANTEATFVLQYEELIVRRNSKYQQTLNLNPGAVVDDLQVQVRVVDLQGVINESSSQFVTTDRLSGNEVLFSYSPSAEQQQEDSVEFGLGRDLTVEYDVIHPSDGAGKFVVDSNCYFAQFFSPSGVDAVPVDLVFVIDVSGSMGGTKIKQTRQALETIINQLRSTDRFTMLTFSNNVTYWRDTLVSVSEYRQLGVQFARGLHAGGSTNFNSGLLGGASVLKTHGRSDHVPLLVILTDGQPTAGVTNENAIIENAVNTLSGTSISLNCLGFGYDLNFNLLERLAFQNNGIVRRIYEGEDAPQQLEGFFEEIASPILKDISINYDERFEVITDTSFPILFNGSEIVVAGKFNCSADTVLVTVNGSGVLQEVVFQSEVNVRENITLGTISPNVERLAAYLIVKQLLAKLRLTDIVGEANVIRQEALELALKYNFVTDLTSLIVVEEGADAEEGRLVGGRPGPPSDPGREGAPLALNFFLQPMYDLPVPLPRVPPTLNLPPSNGPLYIRLTRDTPIINNRGQRAEITVNFEIPNNTQATCTLRRRYQIFFRGDCSNGLFQHTVPRQFGNYSLRIQARNGIGSTLAREIALPDFRNRQDYCYGHTINDIIATPHPHSGSRGRTILYFRMYGPYTSLSCRLRRTDGTIHRFTPCSTLSSHTVDGANSGSYVLTVKPNGCQKKRNLKIYFQVN